MTPRFATALRAAMAERGMTQTELARATGADTSSIHDYLTGAAIPRDKLLQRVTDVLMAPQLIDSALRARTSRCVTCDGVVVSGGSRPRIYCSHSCKITASTRRRRGSRANGNAVARHRLELYQEAVAAFCRECEPDGWCRDSDCRLREVSPLPIATRAVA